ncbi:MAG: hypothetical protein ACYCZ6_01460 [Polaromonas sp.]
MMKPSRTRAQFASENFSNIGFWQVIAKLNVFGALVAREMLLQQGNF